MTVTCNETTQKTDIDLEEDDIPDEIVKEVENFENRPKSNLDDTKIVNLGDVENIKETRINIHLSPSEKEEYTKFLKRYCAYVEEEADEKPWFHDIKKYLAKGEYPELANPTQKCTLQRWSNNFFHNGGIFRTSTRATPYMLVYGTEVVIPAEVEIPSLRIIQEVELDDAEWVKSRYEQLDLIGGKRMNVIYHGRLYQNRMSTTFNKRVKPRQLTPGQLVLKKIFPHQDEAKGKFSTNWQGPYIRVLTEGAITLAEMDIEVWPKPINSDVVKCYYV
ncbi:uncharacterized protein [Nicotiana sylvestris]|uniref:uncharacterized protein n=1 Tax=Nicotiana sylvestris TaxID=4096 RepID=UPI00388CC395